MKNEGKKHKELKEEAAELLKKDNRVMEIEMEYSIKKQSGKYYNFVDVCGLKNDGGAIYVEVKPRNDIPHAILQLKNLDGIDRRDEFVAICNFTKLDYFRDVWLQKEKEVQRFINKVDIYNFDKDLKLKYRDIRFGEDGKCHIDGTEVFPPRA